MLSPETTNLIERFLADRLDESDAIRLLSLLEESGESRDYFQRSALSEYLLRATATGDDLNYEVLIRQATLPEESSMEFGLKRIDPLLRLHGSLFPSIEGVSATSQEESLDDGFGKTPVKPKKSPDSTTDRRHFRIAAVLLLAISLFWIGGIYWEFFSNRSTDGPGTPRSVRPGEKPIAVLTSSADAEFSSEKTDEMLGKPLFSKNLRLESGFAELLFYNGTRLILEGPAEMTLLTHDRVFFSHGNLSATVPVSGHGFEIQTPRTTIRDLGTRFTVDVDSDRCAVQVVQGKVEMLQKNEKPRLLSTGEALASTLDGVLKPFLPEPGRFVSRETMREKVQKKRQADAKRAPGRTDGFPEPIVVYDPNLPCRGTIAVGGVGAEGRTPNRRALKFLKQSDLIRVEKTAPFDSLTLSIWVCLDKIDSFTFNPLLMCDYSSVGGIIWQVAPDGGIGFGFRSRRSLEIKTYSSPIVFTADRVGRWTHLALVVDRSRRTVTHYFDGDVVAVLPFDETAPIRLDDAVIGNWMRRKQAIQQLNGGIDDFRIYDRALSHESIHRLFYELSGEIP